MTNGTMTNWRAERHVRGGYAAARPGKAHAREVLRDPVGDRIWFAGEALAGGLKQTCRRGAAFGRGGGAGDDGVTRTGNGGA